MRSAGAVPGAARSAEPLRRFERPEPEVFEPPAGPGDGGEQSIAGLGFHGGRRCGFMRDAFHGEEARSRPRQHERGRCGLAGSRLSLPGSAGSVEPPDIRRASTACGRTITRSTWRSISRGPALRSKAPLTEGACGRHPARAARSRAPAPARRCRPPAFGSAEARGRHNSGSASPSLFEWVELMRLPRSSKMRWPECWPSP